MIITPTGVSTVDELIRDYSLLRVSVVDSVTTNNNNSIRTWYKLAVIDTISRQASVPDDDLPSGVPVRFLPVNPSEIIYVITGGAAFVEGVSIVEPPSESGLILQKGREYLGGFFLECRGQRATPAAASAAIYEIQGDELRPHGKEDNQLVGDFRIHFGNHLSALRSEVSRLNSTADK